MIFIGIGGNLPSENFGSTPEVLTKALQVIDAKDCTVVRCSPWYRSSPVPVADQPDYINAVFELTTKLPATTLLNKLHGVEAEFERVRTVRNAARTLDLDLLIYHDYIIEKKGENDLTVPHPRMHERAFVLLPLRDLEPDWIHPVRNVTLDALIRVLPADQRCERLPEDTLE
ncbi:MAG: 2-amino-4-hydroxy-6-hydroxymethyldihydropteridine diphosphokinase [Alphaproteobacteria bacterium]|nr:2-amino-4-hydroxy-6-hydroxymethyldihydropteridine diphosphokinase [Alphaproteobacteria bacterium]